MSGKREHILIHPQTNVVNPGAITAARAMASSTLAAAIAAGSSTRLATSYACAYHFSAPFSSPYFTGQNGQLRTNSVIHIFVDHPLSSPSCAWRALGGLQNAW